MELLSSAWDFSVHVLDIDRFSCFLRSCPNTLPAGHLIFSSITSFLQEIYMLWTQIESRVILTKYPAYKSSIYLSCDKYCNLWKKSWLMISINWRWWRLRGEKEGRSIIASLNQTRDIPLIIHSMTQLPALPVVASCAAWLVKSHEGKLDVILTAIHYTHLPHSLK